MLALARLGLDQVWWLTSPQNPLKSESGMAPLKERLANARRVARHPRITVTGIEQELGTRYSCDTIVKLQRRFPNLRFVWIIGADNMVQMPQWKNWEGLFRAAPVAIFDRPDYSLPALTGRVARKFASSRLPERRARCLAQMDAPAWVFMHDWLHPISSTKIRKNVDGESSEHGK